MGLLLVLVATGGGVAFLFYSYFRNRDSAESLVSTLLAVATAAAGAVAWLWERGDPPWLRDCRWSGRRMSWPSSCVGSGSKLPPSGG